MPDAAEVAAPPAKKEEVPAAAAAPAKAEDSNNRGPRRGARGDKTCYNCGKVRFRILSTLQPP
jgi:hypothetical protein